VSAEEDLKNAYALFESADYASAASFFYSVFQSPEAAENDTLKKDMAWNLGLAYVLQEDVNGSIGWFRASGYGPEKFAEHGLGEFYQQVIISAQ
jgi:hypothetical protein